MAHHRTIAVVDLSFLAGRGGDHDPCLGRNGPAEHHDKAPHAGIPGGEAVVVDEVLPDGHGVAAMPERLDDQLSIRLARARTRGATRVRDRSRVGGHLRPGGRFCCVGVGGHLPGNRRSCRTRVGGHQRWGNCRFCLGFAWATSATHRQPRRFQIAADGLSAHTGRLLDARARPTETAQCQDLLSCGVAQDVTHAGDRTCVLRPRQRLGRGQLIAGFAVSINCRF
jgi:hypothetical protein